jgi:hypothetical protein
MYFRDDNDSDHSVQCGRIALHYWDHSSDLLILLVSRYHLDIIVLVSVNNYHYSAAIISPTINGPARYRSCRVRLVKSY